MAAVGCPCRTTIQEGGQDKKGQVGRKDNSEREKTEKKKNLRERESTYLQI